MPKRLSLGVTPCRKDEGWIIADWQERPDVDQVVDFNDHWPWPPEEFDEIRAWSFPQSLQRPAHFMNECWRVLKMGGFLDILVPSTDSRAAFADPTACSFWNANSFLYYSVDHPHYLALVPEVVTCAFKIRLGETPLDPAKNLFVKAVAKKVPLVNGSSPP